jgi:hypothetical protein
MLLLRTRLACLSLSMLERRCGEGEGERSGVFSLSKREGDMAESLPSQRSRGDGLLRNEGGDEFSVYGDDSCESIIFCDFVSYSSCDQSRHNAVQTLVAWLKEGLLRLLSVLPISLRGRGAILSPLEMRSGCTCRTMIDGKQATLSFMVIQIVHTESMSPKIRAQRVRNA